ncbi:uncharacterized protein EAE98_010088 [Botrytis deweyae]|uniref:RGS domain-containing protein n=1 Tax=Botrytis deweyae TaxID=2478750 RepID=A0ABQ7I9N6_9HELO|nr:uncharacterized protein EAE98_010088 [Botrytis deweyae]KAF7917672.1 hypothetical protein EAE98_010088 [Botrytis deweyae]
MCRNQTPRYWCCHIPGRIDGIDPSDRIIPDTPTPAPDCNGKGSSGPSYRERKRKYFQQKQLCPDCTNKINRYPPVKKELKTWSKEIFYQKVTSEVVDFLNDRRRDNGELALMDSENLQIRDSVERHFYIAIEQPYYADLFAFQFEYFRNDEFLREVKRRVFSEKENQIAGKDV